MASELKKIKRNVKILSKFIQINKEGFTFENPLIIIKNANITIRK